MGLSLVLAHQNLAQLRADRTTDLADAVESCVGFEQAFKLAGVREHERVRLLSGEKLDYRLGVRNGSPPFDGADPLTDYQLTETRSPRLGANDLIEISAAPFESLVRFSEGSGLTQFSGYWVPLASEFHVTAKQYDARERAGWPADLGPGAVEVEADAGVGRLADRAHRDLDAARLRAALAD